MLGSYRLGAAIVATTVFASAVFTLAFVPNTPRNGPAGQDLGAGAFPLGSFRLVEKSGRTVTEADLADEVWIASFLFTRCPASCPKIAGVVQGLAKGPLAKASVKFVTISVDPEYDTPAVLAEYAKTRGFDPDRWWFLTGDKAEIYRLIFDRFHLTIAENPKADAAAHGLAPDVQAEAVAHSDRLALVDRGNRVIGVFDSNDPDALRSLIASAKRQSGLAREWVRRLPAINATLNGSCAVLLVIGWSLIRSNRWRGHALCMALAVTVSSVFLGFYLLYHYHVGSVPFRGVGLPRFAYFSILISHTILATFGVVPLVSVTLVRAIRRRFDRHARIARVTFPIWLYVSVTGVIIYLMLYQLPIPSSATLAG